MQLQSPDSPELSTMPLKVEGQHLDPNFNAKERTEEPGGESSQEQRPDSPNPSSVSMESYKSKDLSVKFNNKHPSLESSQEQRPDSPNPSSVSMESYKSKDLSVKFNKDHPSPESEQHESLGVPSDESTQHTDLDYIIKLMEEDFGIFKNKLKKIFRASESWSEEMFDGEEEEQRSEIGDEYLKIAVHLLRKKNQEALANRLQSITGDGASQEKLKSNLRNKFKFMYEGVATAGKPTHLNKIFIELFLTEGGTGEVNDEHEVIQIETTSRKAHRPETVFKQEDIFKALPGENTKVRTVMTKGVAGIGKTILTKKFSLDWAENKTNKDILFTFPFTFRELNALKEKKLSLVDLVYLFFPETKEAKISLFEGPHVVFIFDGLDECRLTLDFCSSEAVTDVTESASVGVLLTSLIKGKLLPSARIWITTRPAAANQIPSSCVDRVTEVRGFTDEQKEDYFKKRFNDQENQVFSHIRKSPSLSIMCHIPVFCWIIATALEDVLKTQDHLMPNTLTEMYIHFLVVQCKRENVKYKGGDETDPHWTQESKKMIETLGKLAFEQLQKGNLIFEQSDLEQCGIDIKTATEYSGVFTQILKEEKGLYQEKVFCFLHLTIQEFLAALHVHLTFINDGVLLLSKQTWCPWSFFFGENKDPTHFYQLAIDQALESVNGHLDLFLRFLLGLSLGTNKRHIRGLLTRTEDSSQKTNETKEKTIQYIKKKMNGDLCAEKSINLLHCLNELEDSSLVEEIQQALKSGRLSAAKLSPAQWSALVFILLCSKEDLEVFDLKKFSDSESALLKLLPVIKASRKALLDGCKLSKRSCEALSSVLSSQSSNLTELDLSYNNLQDEGVELLFKGLTSQHCKLKTLRLNDCKLSENTCKALAPALSLDSSNLTDLDLSNNDLKDAGVQLLSEVLKSPQCKLETLSLSGCLITEVGCDSLACALESTSNLKELDLSYNDPGETGKQRLSALQENENCRLEALRMEHCGSHRLQTGLQKYACQLHLDTKTMNRCLKLSNNDRTVTNVREKQSYPDHPDRFEYEWYQLLCQPELTGRCYWEVDWEERVVVAVSHGGIKRSTANNECVFGWNDQSWSMICHYGGYNFRHANKEEEISSHLVSKRVAVYVDILAGILCFYKVTPDSLTHLKTFSTQFNGSLYAGFGPWSVNSSISLCALPN